MFKYYKFILYKKNNQNNDKQVLINYVFINMIYTCNVDPKKLFCLILNNFVNFYIYISSWFSKF